MDDENRPEKRGPGRPRKSVRDAAVWLVRYLDAMGPSESRVVFAFGANAGHGQRLLKRAKNYAGVIACQEFTGDRHRWVWRLGQCSSVAEVLALEEPR